MSRASQSANIAGIGVEVAHRQPAHEQVVSKPEHIVEAAGLPKATSALILKVVRRCRLWRSERVDLARELVAHFADGFDRGESEQHMIDEFGDADQAATLIRRAKKRNRPWPWKLARAVLLVTALLLLWGIVWTVRFYLGSPTISHDYREDLNRVASTIKPEDAAWPLYGQALLKIPSMYKALGAEPDPFGVRPGEYKWQEVRQFVLDHAASLELARQAAARPGMGLLVGQPLTELERQLWPHNDPDNMVDDDTGMFSILLPHLGDLRLLAKALAVDCRRALAEGDELAAVRDVEAIIGIARHVRETPILINDLVSLAVIQVAVERAMECANSLGQPGFGRELDRLAAALDAIDPNSMRARIESERCGFHDLIQRIYTNDGQGNGRMTPNGLRILEMWADGVMSTNLARSGKPEPSWREAISTIRPIRAMMMLDRREMLATHERLMKAAEAEAVVPLWRRTGTTYDQELERWKASPADRIRYLPLVMMMPALTKAGEQGEFVRQGIDAARTAVALARFRRDHGAWPSSLDQLAPSYLTEIPLDRFDGRPLKYRLGDDAPVLYSVGTDRDDDGGLRTADEFAARRFIAPSALAAKMASNEVADGDWVLFPPKFEPLRTKPPEDDSE